MSDQATARVLHLFYDLGGRRFRIVNNSKRTSAARCTDDILKAYDEETVASVVKYCAAQWQSDSSKLKAYFDPQTIFKPRNFERYLSNVSTGTETDLFGSSERRNVPAMRTCDDSGCYAVAVIWDQNRRGWCRWHNHEENRGTPAPAELPDRYQVHTGLRPEMIQAMKNFERRDVETSADYCRRMMAEATRLRERISGF